MDIVSAILSDDVEKLDTSMKGQLTADSRISLAKEIDNILVHSNPPLYSLAAFYGAVKCFEYLYIRSESLEIADLEGRLLPHFAYAGGSIPICDILDSIAVRLDVTDNQGMKPIHYACVSGILELVQRLWMRGFNLTETDKFGVSCVLYSLRAPNSDVLNFLLDQGIPLDSQYLFVALEYNSTNVMKALIEKGCDPLVEGSDGYSYINAVCQSGNKEMLEFLIKLDKIDVNHKDVRGWSLLHFAADRGQLDICKLLVESGCDINAHTKYGFTPTHAAKNRGYQDVEHYLISQGGILQGPSFIMQYLPSSRL